MVVDDGLKFKTSIVSLSFIIDDQELFAENKSAFSMMQLIEVKLLRRRIKEGP